LPAQLRSQFLRRFLLIVLYDYFYKQVGAHLTFSLSSVSSSYTREVNCVICEIRKPRRQCPGVHGNICTICCGTEREQSIDCPLDCEYLQDAHAHERPADFDPSVVPNQDISITEEFLQANEVLMAFIALSVFEGAGRSTGSTDWDIREALEALIRTYRALQSGIYYDVKPANFYAAGIAAEVQAKLADIKERELKASGVSTIRDTSILAILAFMQRLEYSHNNGRKRSRAFIDFLGGFYTASDTENEGLVEPGVEPIIEPGADPSDPLIIL
jgi:hypothetical protein